MLYRAPELIRATRIYEPTARNYQKGDVYSFAIVLYELQGRHGPFGMTDLTAPEILKKIIAREPDSPPYRLDLNALSEKCFHQEFIYFE